MVPLCYHYASASTLLLYLYETALHRGPWASGRWPVRNTSNNPLSFIAFVTALAILATMPRWLHISVGRGYKGILPLPDLGQRLESYERNRS